MGDSASVSKPVPGWGESLFLFGIATVGEFLALAGWYWLRKDHPFLALLVLLFGFVVERYVVIHWLDVPKRVITPAGNLRALWLVVAGVTIAEIIVWTVWVQLADAHEPWFAAAMLVVGIHLVHGYEVALLKHRELQPTWKDPGVVVLTALEAGGGVWALWLAVGGRVVFPLLVLLGSLLIEHTLQVFALKKD